MKRMIAAALLFALLGTVSLAAQERAPWSIHARFDVFDFSLKAGVEYGFTDQFGLSVSLGACIINPTMITYALTGVSHLRTPDQGLQVDIEYGLIQATFDVLEPILDLDGEPDTPSAYWVPGACIAFGYRFPAGHQVTLRAGAGMMFGYDMGAWQDVGFEPNLGLEYSWRRP